MAAHRALDGWEPGRVEQRMLLLARSPWPHCAIHAAYRRFHTEAVDLRELAMATTAGC